MNADLLLNYLQRLSCKPLDGKDFVLFKLDTNLSRRNLDRNPPQQNEIGTFSAQTPFGIADIALYQAPHRSCVDGKDRKIGIRKGNAEASFGL
jgi:hypothetical protein